jgi:ABC-type transport system involved in cytochrome bd biosynthesis fused ATPase/permease subunit
VLLGVVSALLVIAQAVLLASILADVIIGGEGPAEVSGRLWWLANVIAVRAALAWAAEETARRSATSVTARLRHDVLRHAAALGPRWRSSEHGGELSVLATTGVESLHDYIARYLPQLVLSVVIPLIMLVYLFTADLTSALIVAFTLPLIPLFMALVGWYTDRQTSQKWHSLSRLAGHFTDVVAGLPTLKVFGRAKAQAEAVRRVTDDYRRASMATLRVAFLSSMVLELLASLSVALVAVAIGLRRRRPTCRCERSVRSSMPPRTAWPPPPKCWQSWTRRSRWLARRPLSPTRPACGSTEPPWARSVNEARSARCRCTSRRARSP